VFVVDGMPAKVYGSLTDHQARTITPDTNLESVPTLPRFLIYEAQDSFKVRRLA